MQLSVILTIYAFTIKSVASETYISSLDSPSDFADNRFIYSLLKTNFPFVDFLVQQPPAEAILELLEPIQEESYPSKLVEYKNNLIQYVSNGDLEIQPVLLTLINFTNLSKSDLMVAFLMILRNILTEDCPTKIEVSRLLIFSMLSGYMSKTKFGNTINQCGGNVLEDSSKCHLVDLLNSHLGADCADNNPWKQQRIHNRKLKRLTKVKMTSNQEEEKVNHQYDEIINLLPQPTDEIERHKYESVKTFLRSQHSRSVLRDINASNFQDAKILLSAVIEKVMESTLTTEIKQSFEFYRKFSESLAALNLHTKKEIQRSFDLTAIMKDAFDVDSLLPDEQKLFDLFFKFMLGLKRDDLNSFDTWSEVNTKEQFVQVLFNYLVQQKFVPDTIKDVIEKLRPLVKTTGKAASPP